MEQSKYGFSKEYYSNLADNRQKIIAEMIQNFEFKANGIEDISGSLDIEIISEVISQRVETFENFFMMISNDIVPSRTKEQHEYEEMLYSKLLKNVNPRNFDRTKEFVQKKN